jgi:hypothetical protein
VTSLGCSVPDLLLSSLAPRKKAEIQLANLQTNPFDGTIRISAPDGFEVLPRQQPVRLAVGSRQAIPLELTVSEGVPAGKYPIAVTLTRADGTIKLERTAMIEHLGRRGRVVLRPIEDVHVSQRYPELNKGSAGVLLIDGGNQTMNDAGHSVALMKFRLDIQGKPVRARLRIQNAGNPSGDSGRIRLVTGPWREKDVTYSTRPDLGKQLAQLGRVNENVTVERLLELDLDGQGELSLAIEPTGCDGVDYLSRESNAPPELIVDYAP